MKAETAPLLILLELKKNNWSWLHLVANLSSLSIFGIVDRCWVAADFTGMVTPNFVWLSGSGCRKPLDVDRLLGKCRWRRACAGVLGNNTGYLETDRQTHLLQKADLEISSVISSSKFHYSLSITNCMAAFWPLIK